MGENSKIGNREILSGIKKQAEKIGLAVNFRNRLLEIRLSADGRFRPLEEICSFSRLGGLLVDVNTGQTIMAWPMGRDVTDGEVITRQSLADCLFVLNKYIEVRQ